MVADVNQRQRIITLREDVKKFSGPPGDIVFTYQATGRELTCRLPQVVFEKILQRQEAEMTFI